MAMTLAMCRQAVDTAVTTQTEIVGRRIRKTDAQLAGDLRGTRGVKGQLDLLNRYAAAAHLSTLDYSPYGRTISALNDGSHGTAPAALSACQRYLDDFNRLFDLVCGVAG